jgi:ABC-type protease/lipase transport system fused ATPase/permease subunit
MPKSGRVVIDGRDLSKIGDSERRQTVGFLEQTTSVIDGSLGENISMFDNLVPQDLIATAADLSGLGPLIDKLPLGLDTNIGHDGVSLSAGELQRLGLARAYCHRPKVLFLDEPSANLDEEGDKDLNNYIHQAKYTGRIVIVVSHYVPSGFPFDRTIFVDDGTATFVELTEKGSSDV